MAVTSKETSSEDTFPVHKTLAEALAAFQAECPQVRKSSTANVTGKSRDGRPVSYKYDFADLSTIHEVIDPIKGKHGLSFSARPTMTKGGFVLKYALRHDSGETVKGTWPLEDPHQVNPQEMGKLITYYRRYAECAVLGIAPGGDDDGGENAPKVKGAQPEPIDWSAVLELAADAPDLPALRKLYVTKRVGTAPADVQAAFTEYVNAFAEPVPEVTP